MLFFAYVTCHTLTCWYAYMMYCIYNIYIYIYQYIYLSKGMYIYMYTCTSCRQLAFIMHLGSASQDSQWLLGHTRNLGPGFFPCVWNENAKLRLHFLWKFWEGCIICIHAMHICSLTQEATKVPFGHGMTFCCFMCQPGLLRNSSGHNV